MGQSSHSTRNAFSLLEGEMTLTTRSASPENSRKSPRIPSREAWPLNRMAGAAKICWSLMMVVQLESRSRTADPTFVAARFTAL